MVRLIGRKMFRPYGLEPKGRSYGAIKRGFAVIINLCFDKLNMTENPEHGLKALVQTTCSTHTPANKAALKALAIAKGGITVVPKIFSGEFWHFCGQKCKMRVSNMVRGDTN